MSTMQTFLTRLTPIDRYIQIKGTGSPAQLGKKIGVSERTVYDYLKIMREHGACIVYSRLLGTYYYKEDGHFVLGFIPEFSGKESVN